MGNYDVGIQTRNRILKVCRKLFYEKGYDATTFDDICREGRFNKGTVHYHFRGKYNIARQIFINFVIDSNTLADRIMGNKYPSASLQCRAAVHLRNYISLFFSDENLKRFYYDISREIEFRGFHGIGESYHSGYMADINPCLTEKDRKLFTAAIMGVSASVNLHYVNGFLDIPFEEYLDDRITLFYRLLNVDKERIETIIAESKDVYSGIKIGLKKYMQPVEIA